MPFYSMLDPERVDFSEPISLSDIEYLVSYPKIEVLQCSFPIRVTTWDLLNSEFFRRRPEVELRVYGFHAQPCDLRFASRMSYVRHFAADSITSASGLEAITEMSNLQTLIIGIYNLDNFDFLWKVTDKLTSLLLGTTRSKKPDLSPLSRFQSLTRIYLEGQQKNIDVLSELNGLEDVTLRSITTPNLHYLSNLLHMWSLNVKLGGIRDFSAIAGINNLKYLELWQIRGLDNLEFISHQAGLQNLLLQSLPQITALPSLRELWNLKRITLQNLKGIKDFSELQWAPALQEFILIQGQPQQPEDLLPVLRNPAVRRASAHFGSIKKEERFKELLHVHGIEGSVPFPFNYQ